MQGDSRHNPWIRILIAVLLLGMGLGFGILMISQGISLREQIPTKKELQQNRAYIELLEELEEMLEDPEEMVRTDVDALLDERLEDIDLTGSQKKEIREFYEDAFEQAREGHLEQELTINEVQREIIYRRNMIPDPEIVEQQANLRILVGIVSGAAGIILFAAVIISAFRKSKGTS